MTESQSFIILGLTLEVFHYFIHSLWEKRMIILWSIQILYAIKARQVLCISLKSLVARFSYPQFPHTLSEVLLTRIWYTVLIAVRDHSVHLISVAWCKVIPTIKKTNDKALFHLFIYKKPIYFSKSCIILFKSEAKPDEFGLNNVEYLWPLSENRKCNKRHFQSAFIQFWTE